MIGFDKIIAESIRKVLLESEQDGLYEKAYQHGDIKAAENMVANAAKEWGAIVDIKGKVKKMWHFSRTGGGFNEFRVPAWFSRNEMYATEFFWAKPDMAKPYYIREGEYAQLKPMFGREWWKAKDIAEQNWNLEIDALEGILCDEKWNADELAESKPFVDFLKNNGISYMLTKENGYDEYVVLEAKNIKSAEPFTFDDNGNLIPLSQRFDFSKNDIRY